MNAVRCVHAFGSARAWAAGMAIVGPSICPRRYPVPFFFPLVLLLTLSHFTAICSAATGGKTAVPIGNNNPTAHGLRILVDSRWCEGYGYRPISLEVLSPNPAPGDRTIDIELSLGIQPSQSFISVTDSIEIPAGSSRVTQVLTVPQFGFAMYLNLKVWEDGVPLEKLWIVDEHLPNPGGGYWLNNTDTSRMLFVSDTATVISEFAYLFTSIDPNRKIVTTSDVATCLQVPPAELPMRWLDYSALDFVFISLEHAQSVASKAPETWKAIERWTRAGGNLCIFGAGADWAGLPAIDTLLHVSSVPAIPSAPEATPAAAQPSTPPEPSTPSQPVLQPQGAWQAPEVELFETQVRQAMEAAADLARITAEQNGTDPSNANATSVAPTKPQIPTDAPFRIRRAGLGQIIALSAEQPFPGDQAMWRWMFESVTPQRARWTTRYGTMPDNANPQFNDFLIADAGLPPIRSYQVLITLFVVLIGPVNYWLLKRQGRLHLFLFTVPLAALVTSAALLAYAVLGDGLSTRLRSRSITLLDQAAHEAANLARLSYYGGLAPSEGLMFPADVMLAPLEQTPENNGYRFRSRQLAWEPEQHLTRGWLGARMPTQYVTMRAHGSPRELKIVSTPGAAELRIENQLGTTIQQLVLRDADGKWYFGQQIAAGSQATMALAEDDLPQAATEFAAALTANPPGFPALTPGTDLHREFFMSRNHYYYRPPPSNYVETDNSLLEKELRAARSDVQSRSLAPRSYVVIVDRPEEVVVGLDGASESESLHVIRGTW